MTHTEIVTRLKAYFKIEELVDEQTAKRDGARAWRYFDLRLLATLLFIREGLGVSITINNWFWGGNFSQRGLRVNLCDIVKKKTLAGKLYISGHTLAMAIDFDAKGMSADEVRDWLVSKADELPYKIRLEHKINKTGKTITWVHLDVMDEEQNPKVYLFNI